MYLFGGEEHQSRLTFKPLKFSSERCNQSWEEDWLTASMNEMKLNQFIQSSMQSIIYRSAYLRYQEFQDTEEDEEEEGGGAEEWKEEKEEAQAAIE